MARSPVSHHTGQSPEISMQTPSPSQGAAIGGSVLSMFALLWLAGLYLRIPVLAAPPLATDIAADLLLGPVSIGALTLIPVLLVALGAIPGSWLMEKIGVRPALITGMLFMALMSAARGLADSAPSILVLTALMGLGIAVMQVALPSIVGRWAPRHLALGSAIYMNAMMVGEFAGAGLTLPLVMPLAGHDWRIAIALWSIPVFAIALLLLIPPSTGKPTPERNRDWQPDWRDAQIWRLGLLTAGSVIIFYAINAYMGSVLDARGESESLPVLLAAFNFSPFIASVVMLVMGERWIRRDAPMVISATVGAFGFIGFLLLPGWAGMVSAVLAGFAATIELILLVSLPPAIVSGGAIGRLTSGMTTIGYGIAFLLPLLGGFIAEMLGMESLTLVPAVICAVGSIWFGFGIRNMLNHPPASA